MSNHYLLSGKTGIHVLSGGKFFLLRGVKHAISVLLSDSHLFYVPWLPCNRPLLFRLAATTLRERTRVCGYRMFSAEFCGDVEVFLYRAASIAAPASVGGWRPLCRADARIFDNSEVSDRSGRHVGEVALEFLGADDADASLRFLREIGDPRFHVDRMDPDCTEAVYTGLRQGESGSSFRRCWSSEVVFANAMRRFWEESGDTKLRSLLEIGRKAMEFVVWAWISSMDGRIKDVAMCPLSGGQRKGWFDFLGGQTVT